MRIQIPDADLKDHLENVLDRKPTRKELQHFKNYLLIDVPQWLIDNAKAFIRD